MSVRRESGPLDRFGSRTRARKVGSPEIRAGRIDEGSEVSHLRVIFISHQNSKLKTYTRLQSFLCSGPWSGGLSFLGVRCPRSLVLALSTVRYAASVIGIQQAGRLRKILATCERERQLRLWAGGRKEGGQRTALGSRPASS